MVFRSCVFVLCGQRPAGLSTRSGGLFAFLPASCFLHNLLPPYLFVSSVHVTSSPCRPSHVFRWHRDWRRRLHPRRSACHLLVPSRERRLLRTRSDRRVGGALSTHFWVFVASLRARKLKVQVPLAIACLDSTCKTRYACLCWLVFWRVIATSVFKKAKCSARFVQICPSLSPQRHFSLHLGQPLCPLSRLWVDIATTTR